MKNKIIVTILILSFFLQLWAIPINVSIVGNVDDPGVYVFDSSNRVSQAIQLIELGVQPNSMGNLSSVSTVLGIEDLEIDTSLLDKQEKALALKNKQKTSTTLLEEEEEVDFESADISKRKVILVRNGQERQLNLQEFYIFGNMQENPYLQNEDIIKLLPVEKKVTLTGEVGREGVYEMVSGEKLLDVISLGQGLNEDADPSNIRIERYDAITGQLIVKNVDYQTIHDNPNSENNLNIQHNDLIKVFPKPYLNTKKSVEIKGLVKYPGEYSIDNNSSLLSVLESAGGPLESADLSFAIFIDNSLNQTYDPDLERLLASSSDFISLSEYSYLQTKLRELTGKHYINIKELWETKDSKLDRKVNTGDVIYIKEPILLVNVSGAVQNAGLQPWEDGKTYQEYIADAGGYISSAFESKVRIIRYDTNVWIKAEDNSVINPGDEIFIPEVQDRTFWDYFTEGLGVTAQIITIVLGIHTLTK